MQIRSFGTLSVVLLAFAFLSGNSVAQRSNQDQLPYPGYHWVSGFGASPTDPQTSQNTPVPAGGTIRQIAHLNLGTPYGLRIRLSNALSTGPMPLADVHIARWAGSASKPTSAIVPGSDVQLTFGYGQTSVTIPPNGTVISDAVSMNVAAGTDLVISVYVPAGNTTAVTQHASGNTTVYFTSGDVTGSTVLTNPGSYGSRPYLTSIEVAAPSSTAAIVALGDSITDGAYTTVDGNTRWPDDLAVRLQAKYGNQHGVVNAGIGSGAVISNNYALNAVARLDRDVIAVPGVKYLILYEGVNDIGNTPGLTAAQMIAGYRAIIARAHEANIYVYGGTITPFNGSGYYNATTEALRQAINSFIRTGGAYDGVIDFDKAIADPSNTSYILAKYNADNLHPNNAGLQAMANAIDLTLFDPNTH